VIRLLTGLPRENGIGEYVAHLTRVRPDVEVVYGRRMSPAEFEATGGERPGVWATAASFRRARRATDDEVARTHVTWEGWGPVYGPRTRLLTVHHVLDRSVPWAAGWRHRAAFAAARRGHRRTVRDGVRVVVPSEAVRSDLVRLYRADPSRIEVVPHFIDTALFRPLPRPEARARLGLDPGAVLFLHVGTDDGRKNVPGLLRIHRRLRRNWPSARLVQIGRSPVVEQAVAADRSAPIDYRARVAGAERPYWYAAADVLLLPSRLEGFGRAALEALACDRPVVSSELAVFREELGPQFRPADPDDPERWVAPVGDALRAAHDPARPAWVAERYPPERFVAAYRRLYAESLAAGPGPGRSN